MTPHNQEKISPEIKFSSEWVPEGWEKVTLAHVGVITTGNTPPRKDSSNYGDAFPWVKPSDLDKDGFVTKTEEHLSEKGGKKARLLSTGAVMVSCIGNLGKVGIAGSTLATNQQINSITFFDGLVDSKYGFFYCKTLKNWLEANASATTIAIINKKRFSQAPFLLAPLAEQKRIVAKVDELLARVNVVRERLAKVKEILKRFRQSVLAAACSGRLTEEWRQGHPNIQTAGELVKKVQLNEKKRYLQECEDAKGGGKRKPRTPSLLQLKRIASHSEINTWTMLKMDYAFRPGNLFDGPFGSNLKTSDYTENGVRVIRLENIGFLSFKDEKKTFISGEKYQDLKKHTVGKGDLIVASFIAEDLRAVVLPKIEKAIAKADCFCLRPMAEMSDSRYLAFILSSRQTYSELVKAVHGATRPRITTKQLKNLIIPLAPLKEQKEIVRRVEALFKLAEKIEKGVIKAEVKAEKLIQAILAKAFRGELVPTEAKLARREGRSYEPAPVLLAKIKGQRKDVKDQKTGVR